VIKCVHLIIPGKYQINTFLYTHISDEKTYNVFSFIYLQEHHLNRLTCS